MQPKSNKKVLGIVGSLRKESFNKYLMQAAQKLAPERLTIEIFDLKDIPLFNQDDELNMPAAVLEFKEKIEGADAILIATPEYNYSFPGVLKNALDWASRPGGKNSFSNKPAAVIGTTPHSLGASRAIYHLRQTFIFLDMHVLNKPEIMMPFAGEKFAATGELTDETSKAKLQEFLQAFANWIERLG